MNKISKLDDFAPRRCKASILLRPLLPARDRSFVPEVIPSRSVRWRKALRYLAGRGGRGAGWDQGGGWRNRGDGVTEIVLHHLGRRAVLADAALLQPKHP